MKFPLIWRSLLMMFVAIITLSSLAYAVEIAPLNEEYVLWADITQNGQYFNSDNATITLIDPDGITTVSDAQMTQFAVGIYFYVYNFTQTGQWYGAVTFFNSTSPIAITTQTIVVIDGLGEEQMIPENYLFIIITAMLGFLAYYIRNYVLLLGVGIFLLLTPLIFTFSFGILTQTLVVLLFLLIGISMIYQAIVLITDERKNRDR